MPNLLRRPSLSTVLHDLTPADAGWTYVGFAAHQLADGASLKLESGDREVCIVIVTGVAEVAASGLGGVKLARKDVFEETPSAVYLPPRTRYGIKALGQAEIAICSAPAKGLLPPRVIASDEMGQETRGKGTNTRYVRNILPDTSPHAESLLVVEVITPGGHWSSYPPHKHDTDDFPNETYLEETYYHHLRRPDGFAMQRVYTDDGSLDATMTVHHRDLVLVPKGYHPVGAPHGFDLWYLNVMAGPRRAWKFSFPEAHQHLTW